jgi:hypothetical protein
MGSMEREGMVCSIGRTLFPSAPYQATTLILLFAQPRGVLGRMVRGTQIDTDLPVLRHSKVTVITNERA